MNRCVLPRMGGLGSRLGLVASVLALSACTVGPDYQRPPAPSASRYTMRSLPSTLGHGATAQQLVIGEAAPADWWTRFGSAQLDALVREAVAANPDLAAARAALRQAQENMAAGRATLFPTVALGYGVSRQGNAPTLASPLASNANEFMLQTAQVSVSWSPDLFGGTRRELESLNAQVDAQRYQTWGARLSLIANVVVAAINEAGLRAELEATQRIAAEQRRIVTSYEHQYALGAVSKVDVSAHRAVLAQTQEQLLPLRKRLEQQHDALAALTGHSPDHVSVPCLEWHDLHLPRALPVTVPAQLVDDRPDVLMAAAELHAAAAQVGVAVANRLPQLVLSAGYGSAAPVDVASLFTSGAAFWDLAAAVTQPVFDAGRLKHEELAAEAALAGSKAQYRATVIGALQSVADTLYALQNDADALDAAQGTEHAAALSLAVARAELKLGDASSAAVLQAEQAYQRTRIAVIHARVGRYTDTAALFQALGGESRAS
ncbi:MAG TPA: efflux transporter outer membrane subunit [Nevskiaceae bacterium]|nr:efflux transporter outer membrane subunit [Nevskiaceae bacterium]